MPGKAKLYLAELAEHNDFSALRMTTQPARQSCETKLARQGCGASYQGIALQLAEKVGFALVFGWRSGLPLRQPACFQRRL
jgi:hypothetical protein